MRAGISGMEWKIWPMRTAMMVMTPRAPMEPRKETTRLAFMAKSAATKKVLSPISLRARAEAGWVGARAPRARSGAAPYEDEGEGLDETCARPSGGGSGNRRAACEGTWGEEGRQLNGRRGCGGG